MLRRPLTLTLTGVSVAGLVAAAFLIPTPYAEMSPGPTFDTLGSYADPPSAPKKPVIVIDGATTYPHPGGGELRMVTVEVSSPEYSPSSVEVLAGWLADDRVVVPKTVLYPEGQTADESNAQNTALFADSQDQAVTAAFSVLGIKPTRTVVVVNSVSNNTPAKGKLEPGDYITAVDGVPLAKPEDIHSAIEKHKPGETVTFTVERKGETISVPIVTTSSHDTGPVRALVGFAPGKKDLFTQDGKPITVTFSLDNVGGPSAGMMFSLGIIDKMTADDITNKLHIAGTGTIDSTGKVGPIGGIQMKTLAAKRDGATVFLTPAENCADAVKNVPSGLRLVKVNTLQDAVNALHTLSSGGTPPGCS